MISAPYETFARGKLEPWAKAESVTAFDDLEATAR